MSRGGCFVEIILAGIIVALLCILAIHTTQPSAYPGTLDPVLNHEVYP